ncbi:hypothetical protein NDU88_004889 [Pleurodeles waltl]|uniref:Uncharacterized protein n=1 Tax=Pleurodeles waltl TaxID=8319 RepID=A0AAV7PGZ5_PLEWA|nr:hypothetical protein NDU88_004889 [Pleurodeles waltl]
MGMAVALDHLQPLGELRRGQALMRATHTWPTEVRRIGIAVGSLAYIERTKLLLWHRDSRDFLLHQWQLGNGWRQRIRPDELYHQRQEAGHGRGGLTASGTGDTAEPLPNDRLMLLTSNRSYGTDDVHCRKRHPLESQCGPQIWRSELERSAVKMSH